MIGEFSAVTHLCNQNLYQETEHSQNKPRLSPSTHHRSKWEVSALVPHLCAEHRDGWRGVTRAGCRCPHLPHTGQPSTQGLGGPWEAGMKGRCRRQVHSFRHTAGQPQPQCWDPRVGCTLRRGRETPPFAQSWGSGWYRYFTVSFVLHNSLW